MPWSAESIRAKGSTLTAAFQRVIGRDPTPWERQTILAQAWLESNMGEGWTGEGCSSSHNWGAIQSHDPTCCYHRDSYQDGRSYLSYFRCYPGDDAAAEDLIRVGYVQRKGVLDAARAGDLGQVATLLRQSKYYGGICKGMVPGSPACEAKVIRDYALGLQSRAVQIARAYGEPVIPIGTLPAEGGGSSGSGLAIGGLLVASGIGLLALTLRKR